MPLPLPHWLGFSLFEGGGFVIVDSLFIVAPIVRGGSVFGPCFVMQYLVSFSSFAIVSIQIELNDLL